MTATTRPDPSRTGAVWVTGTGAFLLLAAAAVFTAVRWADIPPSAKLAAIGALTGGFLIAGRRLKATLPATAGALFHLGAFMVPIDVAAVGVRAELDWSRMLLAQGVAATITFAWAARSERSVVLRCAAAAAVVVLAAGVGATSPIPAPLVLSALAVGALLAGSDRPAIAWAVIAGIAPVATFAERLVVTGTGTLDRLGLTSEQPRLSAVITGLAAGTVLAVAGRRRDDVGLALVGALVATIGVAATWTGLEPTRGDSLVGLAAVFLVIELTAMAVRDDAFWRAPAGVIAQIAEVAAGVAACAALAPVALAPWASATDRSAALALGVLAVGWIAADVRTGRQGAALATIASSVCATGAVALATPSDSLLALALAGVAVGAVLLDRPGGHSVAVGAAAWAPVVAMTDPVIAAISGVLGSLVLAEAAVRRSRSVDDADVRANNEAEGWGWVLAVAALLPLAAAAAAVAAELGHTAIVLLGTAAAFTTVAAVQDRARSSAGFPVGTIARLGALSVLAGTSGLRPAEVGLVAAGVALLSLVDAVRLDDPRVALGAALALPIAVSTLCHAAGLSLPASGVALTVTAAVLAGLGSQLGGRWLLPTGAAVVLCVTGGLALASGDQTAAGDALTVTGGIAVAAAIATGRLDGVFAGGAVSTVGLWLRLGDADVAVSEPYLAPVAVLLLVAGLRARQVGTGSWIAYGPTVALLGGSSFAERAAGGAGWHALVAGAVGVAAVACGGALRLAAPLVLGTVLLVAVAGYETLAITASLPTWTWLALGGSVLLGAGIAMERADVGPLETGRRLVDIVDERFT